MYGSACNSVLSNHTRGDSESSFKDKLVEAMLEQNKVHSTIYQQLVLARLGSSKLCSAAPIEQPIAPTAQENIPPPTNRMNNSGADVHLTVRELQQVSVYIDVSSPVEYMLRTHLLRLTHCRTYV